MNSEIKGRPFDRRRQRSMTVLLIVGAVISWLVAAVMALVLVPLLMADPALAADSGAVGPVVNGFAVAGVLGGAVVFTGLALVWRRPDRAAGRVLLLVAGLLATAEGLLLLNLGAVDIQWSGGTAVTGTLCALASIAVGLVACTASLSNWLPGQSLVERMITTDPVRPASPRRDVMLALTAALAVAWVLCAIAVVGRTDLLIVAWFGAVWGLPVLAGVLVAGWRGGEPSRLETLALAAAAGLVLDLLFLLVLGLGYYRFNPIGFAVWWAIMGAILGAIGYGLWGPLSRGGRRFQLRPH